ncbi:hypothetical protein HRG_003251 [Hirsutella rhossiliensis]|uniref:Uncharacterized protein n=1 Tax=Hirsutella rhossiliensis TaxID=111463 RepID=A0A9P8N1N4_9HYPO|nr:uncharacterized protein HRG_03251 [Hirsutella rhossiliensis]KAH0965235.1 hypothetical protein HRG_03251 [Hirsutella rhossiliensis]
MEDPWGDPWAAPVTIELPPAATVVAPPPREAFMEAPDGSLGRRPDAAASPWGDDDDAWGDAGANTGRDAGSGWGMSSRQEPLAGVFAEQPLPDPWATAPAPAAVALDADSETDARVDMQKPDEATTEDDKTGTVSLEARGFSQNDATSIHHPLADALDTNAQDIWAAQEPAVVADRGRTPEPADEEPPPSPGSPDAPTRHAIGAEDRQEAGRQASRVQGLVEMFDGIAKRNMSPAPATVGKKTVAHEDSGPESARGPENEPQTTRTEYFTETSTDWSAHVSTEEARNERPRSEDGLETTAGSGDWQDQIPQGKKGTQHIVYPIDMTRLDDIFPDASAQLPEPERGPATLTDDFFTTVSERKAWYRISRFGSMRCHDQGDPDDYMRVGWATSRVRERTMELVRRWMEQDSQGGRVVLGRRVGLVGGSMFNWDSAAAPVEIAELLRNRGERKTPEAHWRRASAAMSEASTTAARGNLPAAAPWPASFGAEPVKDSPVQGQDDSLAVPLAIPPNAFSTTPTLPAETSIGAPAAFEQPGGGVTEDDADDDDWGDMVSPTVMEPKGPFSVPFLDAGAVVNGSLPTRELAQPRLGGVSRNGTEGMDRKHEDMGKMNRAASPGDDSSLGWAWGTDLAPEVIKPTPTQATQDAEPLARRKPIQHPNPGADHAPLLLSISGTSTDDMMAALDATSAGEGAGSDQVVARILRSLPDLTYMLR